MADEGREYWENPINLTTEAEATEVVTEKTTQAGDGEAGVVTPETKAGEGDAATVVKDGETASPEKGKEAEADATVPTEIKAEDVMARLSPTETPEQKTARLERDYSASSKEALRLKGVNESLQQTLADQHIELVLDADGKVTGLAPSKDYPANADVSLKFSDLSVKEQELAEDDPQGFIDAVLDKVSSKLVRIAPTVDKAVKSLSPERIAEVESYLKGAVDIDGVPKFKDFGTNLEYGSNKSNLIRQHLTAPEQPEALKQFFREAPEMAMEFAHLRIEAAKASVNRTAQAALEALKKKEQASAETLQPGPSSSGGSPVLSHGSADKAAIGSDWGDKIAGARGY